jgi:hypothetical protein
MAVTDLARPIRPKALAIRIVFSSGGNRGRVGFFLFGRVPAFFPSAASSLLVGTLPFAFESNPVLYQRRSFSRYRASAPAEEREIVMFATKRYSMIRVYDDASNVIRTARSNRF